MIFLQFKGIIYYHTNLPKKRIIMPKFNPKMSLSVYSIFSFPVNFLFFCQFSEKNYTSYLVVSKIPGAVQYLYNPFIKNIN